MDLIIRALKIIRKFTDISKILGALQPCALIRRERNCTHRNACGTNSSKRTGN